MLFAGWITGAEQNSRKLNFYSLDSEREHFTRIRVSLVGVDLGEESLDRQNRIVGGDGEIVGNATR